MENLYFPQPDRSKIIQKLQSLPIFGRALQTKRNLACRMCGGSVLPLGRLAWPGAPLCRRPSCELTTMSNITSIFETPYGRALTLATLRIFCRTLEKDRVVIQRQPVVERAHILADGYLDLLRWQETFHDYERLMNPKDYELGRVSLVPPRRLDEVLVFRSQSLPQPIDPTRLLPDEVAIALRRVRKHGPSALEVPF